MSIRGFRLAIVYASCMYDACQSQLTPKMRSGRLVLVAVLGDPDRLLAVQDRDLVDQLADDGERDRPRVARPLTGGTRVARVRVVRVGVQFRICGLGREEQIGEVDGRFVAGALFPRAAVTPQATFSPRSNVQVDAS